MRATDEIRMTQFIGVQSPPHNQLHILNDSYPAEILNISVCKNISGFNNLTVQVILCFSDRENVMLSMISKIYMPSCQRAFSVSIGTES